MPDVDFHDFREEQSSLRNIYGNFQEANTHVHLLVSHRKFRVLGTY